MPLNRLFQSRFFAAVSTALSLWFATPNVCAELLGTQPGEVPADGFVDADYCGQCHGGGINGDYSFLPTDTWAGTMMANAARDPVFFAALTIANQDVPDVGTYCIRCHTPLGFVRNHATPADGSLLDNIDKQGVGCDVCHRATQTSGAAGPYLLGDAQIVFTADTSKRGPYEGAVSPVHNTVHDDGLSDPRFCGQCHFVTNPLRKMRNREGVETSNEFPLDTTFLEWANSSYADAASKTYATCQDCHMKRKLGQWPVSDDANAPLRTDPRRHEFVGGNVWGIDAVMAANPGRANTYARAFAGARAKAEEMLHNAISLTVLSAPARITAGQTLEVKARIENLAGHKFPTGYAESRQAWVALTLVDDNYNKISLVGAYDANTGEIASEPPTHVYRARAGVWNDNTVEEEEHLVLHDMRLSDTRIPPRGFVPTETTMPTEEIDYSDGSGGFRNFDEITLRGIVPTHLKGHVALVVQVFYQSMTREHIHMLAEENITDNRGSELLAIYEATGSAAPIAIATVMQGLEVDPSLNDTLDSGGCALAVPGRTTRTGPFLLLGWAALVLRRLQRSSH